MPPAWHRLIQPHPTRIVESGDLVCVASNETELELPQGAVTCLSTTTGDMAWRFEIPDSVAGRRICSNGGVSARRAPVDGLLVFGDQCGFLIALDAQTGDVVWQRLLDTAFDSEVVVEAGIGYVCTRSAFCMAFRLSDGSTIWVTPHLRGSILFAPILVDQHLYAVALGGVLYRIDRFSGHVAAEVESPEEESPFFLRPAHQGGRIYTGGGGWFYGIEAP